LKRLNYPTELSGLYDVMGRKVALEYWLYCKSVSECSALEDALCDAIRWIRRIVADSSIVNPDWLLIGRQVRTSYDKYIDLLAMDIIERRTQCASYNG
jgi:hypothetical protein